VSGGIRYLPPIAELKKNLKNNPNIIKYYLQTECFIGDIDSINYLQNILKKLNK
jgi:hypothetical protein